MHIDILQPLVSEISRIGDLAYADYRKNVQVQLKSDQSPVTNVDQMIHDEVSQVLSNQFPDIPIISEEGHIPSNQERAKMEAYWLLDPLDGTQDFIDETDEFVISLGYIQNQCPVMGILHHPVSLTTWVAIKGRGVFKQVPGLDLLPLTRQLSEEYTILVSAHRNDNDLCQVIVRERQRSQSLPVKVKPVGSALKFAYLAEGIGHEYLRFNPMHLWDFAAGHCIALEAGCKVSPLGAGDTVDYTKSLIPPLSIR